MSETVSHREYTRSRNMFRYLKMCVTFIIYNNSCCFLKTFEIILSYFHWTEVKII